MPLLCLETHGHHLRTCYNCNEHNVHESKGKQNEWVLEEGRERRGGGEHNYKEGEEGGKKKEWQEGGTKGEIEERLHFFCKTYVNMLLIISGRSHPFMFRKHVR